MMTRRLRQWLDASLTAWRVSQNIAEWPFYALEAPPSGIAGDVACNLALLLAKTLKKSPRIVAAELQTILQNSGGPVSDVQIAGAGFLNFTWNPVVLAAAVREAMAHGTAFGRDPDIPSERV